MSDLSSTACPEPRLLTRPLALVCTGAFVNRLGGFVGMFLLLFLTRHGYSPASAGVAVAAYGAGCVGSSLVGGYLADRIGARAAIAGSMVLAAAMMLALATIQRPYAFLLALCVACGLGTDLYRPAAATLVDSAVAAKRLQAFALYRLAANGGVTIAAVIGGLIAEVAFTPLFVADAATCLVFAGIVVWLGPGGVAARPRAPSPRPASCDRRLVLFSAACALAGVVYFQTLSTVALHIERSGLPLHEFGVLLALNGGIVLLFELPSSRFLSRLPRGPTLALGAVAIGGGMLEVLSVSSPPLLALGIAILSLGELVWSPLALDYVAGIAPVGAAGRYQGLTGFAWSLGLLVAPLFGPWLYTTNRPALLSLLAAFSVAAAAAASHSTRTPTEKDASRTRRPRTPAKTGQMS